MAASAAIPAIAAAAPSIMQSMKGNKSDDIQALPALPQSQPFQVQPIVSSGSSAAPLSFNAAMATPANNMDPQILRLIQMLSARKG